MAITEAQVRRLVQDNPDGGGTNILASDDYSLIITTEPKLYRAAALAARMIASTFAEKVEIAAGSAKIRLQQKYRQYMHYANAFDSRAEEGDLSGATPQLHGISIADMEDTEEDSDLVQPIFKMDKFDNQGTDDIKWESE